MSSDDQFTTVKAFDLTSLLRHAFLTGRGLKDGDKLSPEDHKAWLEYDPSEMNAFKRVSNAIDKARNL
jgi:hypothetical protein